MIKKLPRILIAALFVSCSGGDDDKNSKKVEAKNYPPTIHEKGLREFTGARTKVVWTQYQNPDKVDKQGTSRHHHLMAIDTTDGRGEHRVLEESANYAYPIITPDGEQIVFTRKVKIDKGGKRKFDVTIKIVNFDGSGLRTLGKGYAQEVWEDPETGKYWIYAGDDFVLAGGTAPICKRIIRFPLDDPSKREKIWDKTQMGTDSFAISADGKRFAGLFPWPAAGMGNLETNDWEKLSSGCWVSMAPDNSYDMWVFDGPHKNFLMFDASGEQTATIPVNNHPALKGKEVYHPRWGNDRRFFALSGPHTSGKKKRGKPVEIFLGKFSPELDRVESWFQVSKNGLADIYPDIWIEGTSKAGSAKQSPTPVVAKKTTKWPSNPDGLLFKWENIKAKNEFTAPDGSNQVTRLEPSGFARYGANYEMVLDGGTFEPVLESDALVYQAAKTGAYSCQFLVSPDSGNGELFSLAGEVVFLKDSHLHFLVAGGVMAIDPPLTNGVPTHVAVTATDKEWKAYINGELATTRRLEDTSAWPKGQPLVFGKGFGGTLEHVAFYNRALSTDEIAADYARIKEKLDQTKPIERLQIKGKLVAMSDLPTLEGIDPYVRGLVYYAYETDHPGLEKVAVTHWAILDLEPVPGLPREIGKIYDLIIEPQTAHPELSSQAEEVDIEQVPISLPLYYDVSPLKPLK
ncbi:MAG: hypothetical protein ACI8XO_000471 [Verrucomicrobiales bacterium]|jgi:hypothetical protein